MKLFKRTIMYNLYLIIPIVILAIFCITWVLTINDAYMSKLKSVLGYGLENERLNNSNSNKSGCSQSVSKSNSSNFGNEEEIAASGKNKITPTGNSPLSVAQLDQHNAQYASHQDISVGGDCDSEGFYSAQGPLN